MFLDQNPYDEEHAWKNRRVFLLMLLPTCLSCVILMHVACACPSVVALYPRRSHTPKIFYPITRTIILALKRVGFGRNEAITLSLSLEMEDNYH